MIPYTPKGEQEVVLKLLSCPSAWHGIERYIPDIISDFNVSRNIALEFGVDRGYSTSVLSNFFNQVVGVDTFEGDKNAGQRDLSLYEKTKNNLSVFPNINLVKSNFYSFINQDTNHYNLIHIDIVHEYIPTYDCACWSVNHSDIVLLHDTESFPDVKNVCINVAGKYNLKYYNFREHFGLGILVK